MTGVTQKLTRLMEAAPKGTVAKAKVSRAKTGERQWIDRPVIDYWRTIRGTKVGFIGKEGQGVPYAGPDVLVGDGPIKSLRNKLGKKYAGTALGEVLKKKNMPLSMASFLESSFGTKVPIKKQAAEAYGKYDAWRKKKGYKTDPKTGRVAGSDEGDGSSAVYDYLKDKHGKNFEYFLSWYSGSSTPGAQGICGLLESMGIKGNRHPKDSDEDRNQYTTGKRAHRRDDMVAMLNDTYLLNQHLLNLNEPKGHHTLYRGHGSAAGKYDQYVDVIGRVRSRELSSYTSEPGTANAFGAYGFAAKVPNEAIFISEYSAIGDVKYFKREFEHLTMGSSEFIGRIVKDVPD